MKDLCFSTMGFLNWSFPVWAFLMKLVLCLTDLSVPFSFSVILVIVYSFYSISIETQGEHWKICELLYLMICAHLRVQNVSSNAYVDPVLLLLSTSWLLLVSS